VFVHAVPVQPKSNAKYQISALRNSFPLNGLHPVTRWVKGEYVIDDKSLVLPENIDLGLYKIVVGWYHADTRLLLLGNGDAFFIGQFEVVPKLLSESETALPEDFGEDVEHNGRQYRLLFLRGIEKSGTTWLANIMNLHPQINIAKKEVHFPFVYKALFNNFGSSHFYGGTSQAKPVVENWYKGFVQEIMKTVVEERPEALYVGEKTPGPLLPLMTGSPHIFILRDGRDVLISFLFHYASLGGFSGFCEKQILSPIHVERHRTNESYFYSNPSALVENEDCIRKFARYWASNVDQAFDVISQLRANTTTDRTKVYLVKYEDLWNNTEEERSKIYQFLHLDPKIAFPLTSREIPKFGGVKMVNKFYRKGSVGDWLNFFSKDTIEWFKEEAGPQLVRAAYEKDLNWDLRRNG